MKSAKSRHRLIHNSFPKEGTVQPSHMGSQSVVPDALTTPESSLQAPQMPSYDNSQMAASGEY